MLQQIANRVQRDCVNGEDKLALARTALQSVSLLCFLFWHALIERVSSREFKSVLSCRPPSAQDAKRLESGIQFLNEAEIAGYLLECENILRQQVVDLQILLDGKFPFADQLVQRYNANNQKKKKEQST